MENSYNHFFNSNRKTNNNYKDKTNNNFVSFFYNFLNYFIISLKKTSQQKQKYSLN